VAQAVPGHSGGEAGVAAELGDLLVGCLVAVAALAVAADEDAAGGAAVEVVVEGPGDRAGRSDLASVGRNRQHVEGMVQGRGGVAASSMGAVG